MLDQRQAEYQAGFRRTYQTTDHLATYILIGQKCHEWGIKMWTASTVDFTNAFDSISHKSIWEALKSCNVEHEYISLLRKITETRRLRYRQTKRATFSTSRKDLSKEIRCPACCSFNTVLQYSLKDEIQRWHKKKGMGIYLSGHDRDCLTNLRSADDVMLFATSKEEIRRMMCEFKKATEKVVLRIHPDKTKNLSNQSTINSDTKKHIEVSDMIEILTRNESVKYLGQRISFYQQETTEIKSRIRAAWATFQKYRQELTSKTYMLKHRLRLFDAHSFSDYLLRSGNMGTKQRTRKNDSINATQDATTHYPDPKGYTNRLRNKTLSPKTKIKKVDITDMCSADDESGYGQSTKTHDDVDSEVTFEDDADEEMDTTAIEEEDWIEYIKRSTVDAMDKMERAKIRCWNKTHKK